MRADIKIDNIEDTDINTTSSAEINRKGIDKTEKIDTAIPHITSMIGKGEDAKNSIIWTTIRLCLYIPSFITVLYFITMWGVYWRNLDFINQVAEIRDHIIKIWSFFGPLITLALGYFFGKNSDSN